MNRRIGNNKIYLLGKEAGLIEFEQLDWNPELGSPTYESVVKARKFAELILERVIEIVGDGGEFASRPKLIEKIKNEFGIEE